MYLKTERLVIFTTNPDAGRAAIILNENNRYDFPDTADCEETICLHPEKLARALKESCIGTICFGKNGEKCELDQPFQGKSYATEAIVGVMEFLARKSVR